MCESNDVYEKAKEYIQAGSSSELHKLLESRRNSNFKVKIGESPLLHLAVKENQLEIAQLLISHGVDLNAKDDSGDTALHIGIRENNLRITELLLENNADANLRNKSNHTPVHVALESYKVLSEATLCDCRKQQATSESYENISNTTTNPSLNNGSEHFLQSSIQHCIALTQHKISEINSYGIHFKESLAELNDFLDDDGASRLLTLQTKCIDLTLISVVDELKRRFSMHNDFFIFDFKIFAKHMTEILEALEQRTNEVICIIIECPSRLLLRGLSNADHGIRIISIERSLCEERNDENLCFENLEEESQNLIMSKEVLFHGQRIAIQQIFGDFEARKVLRLTSLWAIAKEESIHIAEENGIDIEMLPNDSDFYIERALSRRVRSNPGNIMWQYDTRNLVEGNVDDLKQLITVSGDSGMGTSRFLYNLKLELQEYGHWATLIHLNDYTLDRKKSAHLSKVNFERNDIPAAILFLTEMLRPIYKSTDINALITFRLLQLFLLSYSRFSFPRSFHRKRRLVILFDGFSQIDPEYQENVFRLIEALNEYNRLEMWITIRPHDREKFSQRLQSTQLVLNPFKVDDQLNFLLKSCSAFVKEVGGTTEVSEIRCRNIATLFYCIVEGWSYCESYQHELQALLTSLNLSSMPKVWEDLPSQNIRQFMTNPLLFKMLFELSLHSQPLTDLNFTTIYEKFVEMKFRKFFENTIEYRKSDSFKEYERLHCQFAWISLFSDTGLSLSTSELYRAAKIGLISKQAHRYSFINRSFAEYFVSIDLMSPQPQVSFQLVNRVLVEDSFQGVCDFLNDKLKYATSDQQALKIIRDEEIVWQPNDKGENILHVATERGHVELLKCFALHLSRSVWLKLVRATSNDDETVIDKAALSTEYSDLFEFYEEHLGRTLLEKVLGCSFRYYFRLLQIAVKSGNYKKIFGLLKKLHPSTSISAHLPLQNEKQETIAHFAAAEGDFKAFLEAMAPQFNRKTFKSRLLLATDKKGLTILHSAIKAGVSESVIPVLAKYMDKENLCKLLMKSDHEKRTILHLAARDYIFEEMTNIVSEHLSKKEFKNLASSKDSAGQTCLHFAVRCLCFDEVVGVLKSRLCKSELKELISTETTKGETVLHKAACFGDFASTANLVLEYLGKNAFKDFVMKKTSDGWTCLHFAAYTGQSKIVFDFIRDIFLESNTKEFLSVKTNLGETLLHIGAARAYFATTANLFLDHLGEQYFKEMVRRKDNNGCTSLHFAAAAGGCEDIIEFLEDHSANLKISELLSATTNFGLTLLHIAVSFGHFQDTAELIAQCMEESDFRDLLMRKDNDGWTCLHFAASSGKFCEVYGFLSEFFSKYEINNFLFDSTENDETLLHIAALSGHFAIIANLILDHLGQGDFEKLMMRRDFKGRTCLQFVAEFENCNEVLRFIEKHVPFIEITESLIALIENSEISFNTAVNNRDLKATANSILEHLGKENLKTLLKRRNSDT